MAAITAFYNTPQRLEELNAYEPFENYCTDGLALHGKHIGVVGHLNMPRAIYDLAASVRIAGLVFTNVEGMKDKIRREIPGPAIIRTPPATGCSPSAMWSS